MDRNKTFPSFVVSSINVALRKESVDRNDTVQVIIIIMYTSLSARRAWIEISGLRISIPAVVSLSARRAWIEMTVVATLATLVTVALRKESVDRNFYHNLNLPSSPSRSPQGERG